ncbi:HAD-IIIC family phosphatase [Allosalinactinospora lopnorensis]|uniref:HAD-IIIC family phosphatase n=1 Tax=Allosalinactinospora lopnorensis TaxID=1352348 RepID=UPI000A67D883|nr:HAD-IIIC family phosphatase [Allosalinactinospora lopnorensis]
MGRGGAAPGTVKCLVWDLDNTLWKGVLLEGDEVELPGEIRGVVTELDSRGILQSVASKNDQEPAWERLEKLGIAEYFILPEINWGPKSDSVRRIAAGLEFAESTVAFIDDQPTERAEVSYHLPQVRCYDAAQAAILTDLPDFTPEVVTKDARRRREMYRAGSRRKAAQQEFTGPDEDFLRSLDLEMRVERATEAELARVEELTRRTSQMNATGVHYSHAALSTLLADPRHEVLVATLTDRFGPHGAIGIILLERNPANWHLKLLATSCRVVSFGAGAALLNWLIDQAARAGNHLTADFRRTERNRMMEVAYRFAGFTGEECDCLGILPAVPETEGVERLHMAPTSRSDPSTIRLVAPHIHEAGEKGRRDG